MGIDSDIRIRLNLTNTLIERNRRKADPAFGTKIDVYFPTSFVQFSKGNMVKYKNQTKFLVLSKIFLSKDDTMYSCLPISSHHVRCKMTDYLNNPFPPGKSSTGELIFKLSNVSLSNILRFDFNATTLTNETNLDNNNVTLLAKVLLKTDLYLTSSHEPEQVSISGDQTLGISSIKNIEEFGTEVTHIYRVGF